MALQYGVNISAGDMRNMLERNDRQQSGVRSWRQLFGGASLGYESQADTLKSYYNEAMTQAYKTNFAQQNAIMGAGLNVGATRDLISANRQDLQAAYDTYIKGYSSNLQTAAETYGGEISAIDTALTERSTNFASLYNRAYDYLSSELYGSKLTRDGAPIYEKDKKTKEEILKGYEQIETDYLESLGLDWLVDKDNQSLKSWDDIKSKLMNDDGSLNELGKSFFDQMFNARPEGFLKESGEKARSFDSWLSEEDNDLYNWLGSQDAFNYTFTGTNLGTANVLRGRESGFDTISERYTNPEGISSKVKEAVNKINEQDNISGESSGLADIGKLINKQTYGTKKEMSYDDWFKSTDKLINNFILNPKMHEINNTYKMVGAMRSYIETYERTMNTEIDTFRSEISRLFGEEMAEEFWSVYGKDIDTQLKEINALIAPTKGKDFYSLKFMTGEQLEASLSTTKNAYNLAMKLRNSKLTDAISQLYKDLNIFISKKNTTQSRFSGF